MAQEPLVFPVLAWNYKVMWTRARWRASPTLALGAGPTAGLSSSTWIILGGITARPSSRRLCSSLRKFSSSANWCCEIKCTILWNMCYYWNIWSRCEICEMCEILLCIISRNISCYIFVNISQNISRNIMQNKWQNITQNIPCKYLTNCDKYIFPFW